MEIAAIESVTEPSDPFLSPHEEWALLAKSASQPLTLNGELIEVWYQEQKARMDLVSVFGEGLMNAETRSL